jgi:hypothetical protein
MKFLLLVDCNLYETSSAAQMMYDLAMEISVSGHQIIFLSTNITLSNKIQIDIIHPSFINIQVRIKPTKTVGRLQRAINERWMNYINLNFIR